MQLRVMDDACIHDVKCVELTMHVYLATWLAARMNQGTNMYTKFEIVCNAHALVLFSLCISLFYPHKQWRRSGVYQAQSAHSIFFIHVTMRHGDLYP